MELYSNQGSSYPGGNAAACWHHGVAAGASTWPWFLSGPRLNTDGVLLYPTAWLLLALLCACPIVSGCGSGPVFNQHIKHTCTMSLHHGFVVGHKTSCQSIAQQQCPAAWYRRAPKHCQVAAMLCQPRLACHIRQACSKYGL